MKSPLILLIFLFCSLFGYSQTSSGNRFWVAYMENLPLFANDDPVFIISVDATEETNVTISRPANGWSQAYTAGANTLTNITLPSEIFYTIGEQVVDDFGFLIETDNLVKVVAIHNRAYFSETTTVLPESTIGSEYILSAYIDASGFSPSEFVVVATQNNTEVEITPSVATTTGNPADTPFTVTLNEGQSYQVKATQDLTGTMIRSLGSEKIAVFGGAQQANVSICNGADNHLYEQSWPITLWDDLFYFVPFKDQGGDVLQIVAAEDNTTIFFDCNEITTLDQGEYYNGVVALPTVITATNDVAVMQLNESQTCNPTGVGDPNMVQVSPIRYKTTQTRFFANGNINGLGGAYFSKHLVNIISKTADVGNVQLDGNTIENEFEVFTADPTWSYAQIQLNATGIHEINSSTSFQAYSYGFGDFDAYATALGYEEVQEEVFACLDIEVEGLFCVDSILTFSTSSNLEIVEWDWTFGDGGTSMEAMPNYAYANAGGYTVTVDVVFANGGVASASLDLQIFDCPNDPCGNTNPNISFELNVDACAGGEPVTFTYNADIFVTSQSWDFGNGFTSTDTNPVTSYNVAGTYTVTLTLFDQFNCDYIFSQEVEIPNCDPCAGSGFVDLTYDGPLCTDSLITLIFPIPYDPDSNPFLFFQWFINGEISEEESPSVILPTAGPLVVEFLASDLLNGCDFFGVLDLEVVDCDDPCQDGETVGINLIGSFCVDSTLVFGYQTTANLISVNWQSSDGQTGVGDNFSISFNEPGSYTVQIDAEDSDGCTYQHSITFEIVDCGDPCQDGDTLELIADGSFCIDASVNITYDATADLISINWQSSDGQTGMGNNFNISFDEPGTYTVQIDAEDTDGCTYQESISFEIEDCGEPCQDLEPIDILISTQTCVDSIISFDVGTAASVIEFMWTFSTGQTFNVIAPDLVFSAPGIYSATLFAIDVDGCEYETTEDFEVVFCEEEPCQDLPDIDIEIDGELCASSTLSFSFSTTANLISTVWELDTGESSNEPNFSFTPNQAGNYLLSFFAEDTEGCTYLEEVLVFVEDCSPDCDADLLIEVEGLFCDSTLLDFSLSANVIIVNTIWDISNGSTFNEAQFSTTFLEAGTYDVFVLAEADDGCIYSEELLLEISACTPENICGLGFPNAFSPNDDGFNDEFRAYFECPPLDFDLQIFSRWGELVFETDDPSGFWNGRFKNKPLGVGVYVWVAEYTNNIGETVQVYGDVMLLR